MVLSRQHGDPKRAMSDYVELLRLTPISIDDEIAGAAQDAFIRFGKGRHPARLNLCDCFSYAVARTMSVPLLFVGEDFAQTDIVVA
jgi:ribonuclease VapC